MVSGVTVWYLDGVAVEVVLYCINVVGGRGSGHPYLLSIGTLCSKIELLCYALMR